MHRTPRPLPAPPRIMSTAPDSYETIAFNIDIPSDSSYRISYFNQNRNLHLKLGIVHRIGFSIKEIPISTVITFSENKNVTN